MRRIVTAMAAIALVTTAAQAQAQGNGRGNDRGGGKPAEAGKQGGGNGNAERGNRGRDDAGPSMAQSARGSDNRGNGNADRGNANVDRGNGGGSERNAARSVERARSDDRGRGNDNRTVVIDRRSSERAVVVDRRGGPDVVRVAGFDSIPQRGLINGCPPGLAKKRNGCQPPGQVGRDDFRRVFDRPDFWGLNRLGDGRYFYDDGYLVRYAPSGGILGHIPLLGGALGIGNAWPSYYEPVALPDYYESYYGLGSYDSYRYADDVIYRVDPETAAITSIAALLTGDQFAVGQRMPLGYDVYNVPYAYRDRYTDRADANYRYSDGYVYQVDPTTQLIAAAIELLT